MNNRKIIELRETLTEILGKLKNNLDTAHSQSSVSLVQRSYGLFGQEVQIVVSQPTRTYLTLLEPYVIIGGER